MYIGNVGYYKVGQTDFSLSLLVFNCDRLWTKVRLSAKFQGRLKFWSST